MAKILLIDALCVIVGAAAGFGLMFWVAKEMVRKVRAQENARHQELLSQYADAAGPWIDVVNDIIEGVQQGKLAQKSIPDQVKIVRKIVEDSRKHE